MQFGNQNAVSPYWGGGEGKGGGVGHGGLGGGCSSYVRWKKGVVQRPSYIDDDPRSAFVPRYVISSARRCNGGVVIPAARSLPVREKYLYASKVV